MKLQYSAIYIHIKDITIGWACALGAFFNVCLFISVYFWPYWHLNSYFELIQNRAVTLESKIFAQRDAGVLRFC
jgi:hypothetical protein